MSGIYIPGIEMPKRCNECRFLEGDNMDGLCHAADRWMDDEDYWTWYVYVEDDIDTDKPANCPLVSVPDHGRLVDADALHKHMVKVHNEWKEHPELHESIVPVVDDEVMILCFPTIIPADKEGADDV